MMIGFIFWFKPLTLNIFHEWFNTVIIGTVDAPLFDDWF
jgi:hypothetical protein